jgi:chromate reductase, NAD(P)H dehydrogenase (quinone)
LPHLVAIAGSLRQGSYNASLVRAAAEVLPAGWELEVLSLRGIPLYDGDVEAREGLPEAVKGAKEQVAAADAVLLATPEYNNSLPGVLKNAIDWMSRPAADMRRVFGDRPLAIVGATPGPGGTILAQAAWLPVLRTLGVRLFTGGRLQISSAGKVFDAEGRLVDDATRERLRSFMAGFCAFAAHGAAARP